MSEVIFGWIGQTRRASVVSLITEEVMSWSADWWLHHQTAEVEVAFLPDAKAINQSQSRISSTGSGSLAMNFSGRDVDGLGRHLCGTADSEDAGWAQRVGAEALEKLSLQIFERAHIRSEVALSEGRLPLDLYDGRVGAICVRIALGRINWLLHLDRALVNLLTPLTARETESLNARAQALECAVVRLTASIDFGSMAATDLLGLRIGEILVSDRALHEPVELQIDGHGAVAIGYMRSKSDRYALVLDKS